MEVYTTMDYNGAVVTFHKFGIKQNIRIGNDFKQYGSVGPICLGSFDHVNVKTIRDFRKFVSVTSKHQVEYPYGRKQLLLRRIKKLEKREEILMVDSEQVGNALPFQSMDGRPYALCCLCVFSVSEESTYSKHSDDQKSIYAGLAENLYGDLDEVRNQYDCRLMVLETLGVEDLCLIVLSNQYEAITEVVSRLRSFGFGDCPSQEYQHCHIGNMNTILMIDRCDSQMLSQADLGSARAELRFALSSVSAMHYVEMMEKLMRELLTNRYREQNVEVSGNEIILESGADEYDAILRCPAWILPIVMGVPGEEPVQGCFHPDNAIFQNTIDQFDAHIYSSGLRTDKVMHDRIDSAMDKDDAPAFPRFITAWDSNSYKAFVSQVLERLKKALITDDSDFDFVEFPIWQRLKEFRHYTATLTNEVLIEDLEYQFKVAINAIVKEAELSRDTGNRAAFMEKYDRILKVLDGSMKASSQQDNWHFDNQQSYVTSYHKVLRCYYGMLKAMITLIYRIPRTSDTIQPYLIPMLSFGTIPLIRSSSYESYIDHYVDPSLPEGRQYEKNARIISIELPYQALANPAKYMGMLAHEIFHYTAPVNRASRNKLMCCGLIRVALSEFIDILANNSAVGIGMDAWELLYSNDETFREIVDIAVENTFINFQEYHSIEQIRLRHIRKLVWDGALCFTVNRMEPEGFKFYFQIWCNVRAMLMNTLEPDSDKRHPDLAHLPPLRAEYLPYYTEMFATNIHFSNKKQGESLSELQNLYESRISKTSHHRTKEARNLLRMTYSAMVECPSDIFNLEVVMHRRTPVEKIQQYFWQQCSAKRDILGPKANSYDDHGIILQKNDIRNAMVVSCYLYEEYGQDHPVILEKVLELWGQSSSESYYADARKEFIRTYEIVYRRFRYLFRENREICSQIADLIRNHPDARLQEILTQFYFSYYNELIYYQDSQGMESNQNHMYDSIFYKTCELIDEYQIQSIFVVEGLTSAVLSPHSISPPFLAHPRRFASFFCDETAYTSAEFLDKLILAQGQMMVNGKMPMLWYRGQQEYDWSILPNLMRIDRMISDEPEEECLSQLLYYESQLARVRILPTKEPLSDAEWLGFLQHYGFKTNVLDFSEMPLPALYFATETWVDNNLDRPKKDAVVMVFNPVLFNLVMELFESEELLENICTTEKVLTMCPPNLMILRQHRQEAKRNLMEAKKTLQPISLVHKLEDEYAQYHIALRVLSRIGSSGNLKSDLSVEKAVVLDSVERAKMNLKRYYETGINFEQPPLFTGSTESMDNRYRYLYDPHETDTFDSCLHPRAVMVPNLCDRMAKQNGQFVYFNPAAEKALSIKNTEADGAKRVYDYSRWSLEALHKKYEERCYKELMDYQKVHGEYPDGKFVPFLFRIKINCQRHFTFKRYVQAVGMQRYSVYPEYDKLAADLIDQLDLK